MRRGKTLVLRSLVLRSLMTAVVASSTLGLSCGPTTREAGPALQRMDELFELILGRFRSGGDDLLVDASNFESRIDDVVALGDDLSAAERGALEQAVLLQRAQAAAQEVTAAADQLPSQAQAEAASTVNLYVDGSAEASWRQAVEDVMTNTIQGTTCEVVGNMMTPSEREREGLFELAGSQLVENAITRAFGVLDAAGWTGFQEAIAWAQWGTGVVEQSDDLAASIGGGYIEFPDGQWTRAYIYYLRACHSLPG
jgi:hypothetical protein